jgi:hypothetical protein
MSQRIFNIYSGDDIEYTNPYVRFIKQQNNHVWDNNAGALAASPTYANSAIAISKNNGVNGWAITIPTALPNGTYDVLVYNNATPANTDVVKFGAELVWNGDINSVKVKFS